MKSIKEKRLLVKWAKAMNEPIDPAVVAEVEQYERIQKEIIESVRTNTIKDIVEASIVAEKFVEEINIQYPKPPTLDEVMALLQEQNTPVEPVSIVEIPEPSIPVVEETTEESTVVENSSEVDGQEVVEDKKEKTLAELAANFIAKEVSMEKKADDIRPADPQQLERSITELMKKMRFMEQTIGNLMMQNHGSGGGSVRILDNDDVEFKRLNEVTENAVLIFDAAKKKFVVRDLLEFIEGIQTGVEVQYNKLIDVEGNYTYIGEATPGTATNSATWRIKRVEQVGSDINILWANGTSEFDKTWDDRLTYTYF